MVAFLKRYQQADKAWQRYAANNKRGLEALTPQFLLMDYSENRFLRFLKGHWRSHHTQAVRKALKRYGSRPRRDHTPEKLLKDLYHELKDIEINKQGRLAAIINVIASESKVDHVLLKKKIQQKFTPELSYAEAYKLLKRYSASSFVRFFRGDLGNKYVKEVRQLLQGFDPVKGDIHLLIKELKLNLPNESKLGDLIATLEKFSFKKPDVSTSARDSESLSQTTLQTSESGVAATHDAVRADSSRDFTPASFVQTDGSEKSSTSIDPNEDSLDRRLRKIDRAMDRLRKANQRVDDLAQKVNAARGTVAEDDVIDADRDLKRVHDAQKLGEGGEGTVYKVKLDGDTVALKVVRQATGFSALFGPGGTKAGLRAEAELMQKLASPYIVELYQIGNFSVNGEAQYGFTMELAAKGSVYSYMYDDANGRPLAKAQRMQAGLDVAKALEYLATQRIVHADVKSQNVLLLDNAGHAKLTDFGIAVSYDKAAYFWGGTRAYMAPEIINKRGANAKSDMYSYGVFLCEMAMHQYPESRNKEHSDVEVHQMKQTALAKAEAKGASQGYLLVVKRAWAERSDDRISAAEAVDSLARLAI